MWVYRIWHYSYSNKTKMENIIILYTHVMATHDLYMKLFNTSIS